MERVGEVGGGREWRQLGEGGWGGVRDRGAAALMSGGRWCGLWFCVTGIHLSRWYLVVLM